MFEKDNAVFLEIYASKDIVTHRCSNVTTEQLGLTRISEGAFENPDGSKIDFITDINGISREGTKMAGPFAILKPGAQTIMVWSK